MVIKMKKNIIILSIGALFIALGVLFFVLANTNKYPNITTLDINELKEKINNKDSFIMVITQDGCTHCHAYLPVLNKVAGQYNIDVYNISQTGLSTDDSAYLKSIANISGTPTTVFIEDGEEKSTLNRLVGNVAEYKLIDKLKGMGYINE